MGALMELLVLINRSGFTALSRGRVLNCSESHSITQVSDLIGKAQGHCDAMRQEVRDALASEQFQAYNAGLLLAKQELASRLAEAEAARFVTLNDLAPTLVDIVMDAVSVVLKRSDPLQLMDGAIFAVGDMLRQARWARLRVHPSRAVDARRVIEQLSLKVDTGAQIVNVIADPECELHACVFETDIGIADASLDVQLSAIRAAVEAAVSELARKNAVSEPFRRRWNDATPSSQ